MNLKCKKIGISGGTFDPVHYGHLIVAEEIREKLGLDKVVFIPAGMPPHKDITRISSGLHRYNMVCDAVATNPFFEVSRIELDRKGYTYTVDTLSELKQMYGDSAELFFITGADMILDMLSWKQFEKLFLLCEFIAVKRPGYKSDDFIKEINDLKTKYQAKIRILDAPMIGISSTIIRERVKTGKSIKYLVPENVEKYIVENKLYR